MNDLISMVQYIADRTAQLKNKFTKELRAPVEFACIFCQSEEEYQQFTNSIVKLGKVVEKTQTGHTYLLDKPIKTTSGNLRLVKIRKPDPTRPERGDVDFNTNYEAFKETHKNDPKFELIKRKAFEMLRLSDPNFDTMACFSNIPKSKDLGINL